MTLGQLSKLVTVTIVLLLSQLVHSYDGIQEVKLGLKTNEQEIKVAYEFAYFKLEVATRYVSNRDLIIEVVPSDYMSDPDIYISKSEQRPSSYDKSDWQCSSRGKDVCSIHHSNFTANDTFYMGVRCRTQQCKFTIFTLLTSEIWLEDGVDFVTQLWTDSAKLFKFKVPPEGQTAGGRNQSITIKASAYQRNVHDIILRAKINQGEDNTTLASTGRNDLKGFSAWKKGSVIQIEKSNFGGKWCSGCEIEIMIDVTESGFYQIIVQTNEATPLIQSQKQIDDIVKQGESQCYRYYVKENNTDLQISMTTYSGEIDVRVNPLTLPDNWDQFKIKRNNTHDMIIDIPPWFRRQWPATGLYYVCVHGVHSSTYTLKVREFIQSQEQSILEDGYSEQFFLRGNNTNVHLYHAPKLDYTNEEIWIEIDLVVQRGARPLLGAHLCQTVTAEECQKQVTKDSLKNNDTTFYRGRDNGQLIKLIMRYNGSQCQDQSSGGCYYVILSTNPSKNFSSYQMTVSHTQKNHILLQEGQAYVDSVENRQVRYYKYSIIDDQGIQNVSFELSSLHGISGLYVSRVTRFPSPYSNEQKSYRGGHSQVTFTKPYSNSTLAATYYVAVSGYGYASYSILVHSRRATDYGTHSMSHLIEGVPFQKYMYSKYDVYLGSFDVSIGEDDDKSILFDLIKLEGEVKAYLKYGSQASPDDYDFTTDSGIIKIDREDKFYHKEGTYFIYVAPVRSPQDLFKDSRYSFRMWFRYTNSLISFNSHDYINLHVPAHEQKYLQHHVVDVDSDILISLADEGKSEIFVSLKSSNKYPNKDNNDFTTLNQIGDSLTTAKSLFLSGALLKSLNPACIDLGFAEEESCVIYIGVQCNEDTNCYSQLSIEYENSMPKKIVPGSPRHSQVETGSYSYYYMTVQKKGLSKVNAVLMPILGDADLLVNLQHDSVEVDQWDLPTLTNWRYRSSQRLKTKQIRLGKKELEKCFPVNATESDECIIIYGVYAIKNESDTVQKHTSFSLVVYEDVLSLYDGFNAVGYVREKEFSYYIYQTQCQNCTILFSLSSYTGVKPDIYVVQGNRLPSLNDYDVKKSTIHSDVVILNLDSDFIKNSKTNSMQGYYIIGVYGYQNSTFQLSAISQEQPVISLTEGQSVQHQQSSGQITYFQFYSWEQKKDIEFEVSVPQGEVNLYINTFTSEQSRESFISQLPKNKKSSLWHSEGINSINLMELKELLILQDDRNFCSDCYYLIGIVTGTTKATYSIVAKHIEAEKTYTTLLSIGEIKQVRFNKEGQQKIYQFMLDTFENAQIIPTILSGQISMTVSYDKTIQEGFETQTDSSPILISGDNLKTETTYYILLTSLTNYAEITLTVQQQKTVLALHDGIPQYIKYTNHEDASKYIKFDFPGGNNTLMFNIRSRTRDFFPILYYRIYSGKEVNEKIIFPPSESVNFDTLDESMWDKEQYQLKKSEEIIDAEEDSGLAMNLLYNNRDGNRNQLYNDTHTGAQITVSYSNVVKLPEGEEYLGELKGARSYLLFKVNLPAGKNLYIEFSQCVGLTSYSVIADPSKFDKKVQILKTPVMGREISIVRGLQEFHYILVQQEGLRNSANINNEFILKYKYIVGDGHEGKLIPTHNYAPQSEGFIKYDYIPAKEGTFRISWGELYEIQMDGSSPKRVHGVKYLLARSSNPRARLDTACAAKSDLDVFYMHNHTLIETQSTFVSLKPGEELYFNVFAIKGDEQIMIPYQPVTIIYATQTNSSGGGGSMTLVIILTILFIITGTLVIFFYRRGKKLQDKIDIELRDMSGGEGTPTETYRRVIPVDASIGDVGDVSSKSYNKFIDEKVDASIDMESERHGGGSSERHSDRIL